MHIVADENMPALDDFERLGRVTRVDGRSLTRADLRDADILLVRSVTPVTEALLADTPVRFVGSATIGTDHVDLDALDRLGIAFACAPGCNARAVAEHVLQALLMASQHHGRPLRGSTPKSCVKTGCGHAGAATDPTRICTARPCTGFFNPVFPMHLILSL